MLDTHKLDATGIDPGQLADAMTEEQVRLLIHKRVDLPINMVNGCIVTAALWSLYPDWMLITWLAVFALVILARHLLRRHFQTMPTGVAAARRWGLVFTVNAFATACLWGATGSVVLVTPDPVYHVFIVFVLGGMMAGGIVANAAYQPAMFAFTLPTILPVVLVLFSRGDIMHVEMGWMLLLFAAVIVSAGSNINRSIKENFRLRLSQDQLLGRLRASDSAMADAQAIAHVGSWEFDVASATTTWTAETYRIYGVDPLTFEPTYEAIMARIDPLDRATVGERVAKLLAGGEGHAIDHRIVMDDGTLKYVHEISRAHRDAAGTIRSLVGTVQDITEQRVAEGRQQFVNILLKTQTESSPDGILVVDAQRRIISFNQRLVDIWKITRADLLADTNRPMLASSMSGVKDQAQFLTRVEYLYAHPDAHGHDQFEMADGRFIERDTVTLTSPSQEDLGRVWYFRDITERQTAANELAYRERLLHAVTVGTGILVKTETLDIGMPEALRIVGESLRADRVLMMQNPPSRGPPELRYSWESPGVVTPVDLTAFSDDPAEFSTLGIWRAQMNDGSALIAQRASSEGAVRKMMEFYHNESTLLVPIFVGAIFWGNLAADSCSVTRAWTKNEIDTLSTFGGIAGALLVHHETRLLLETSEQRFRVLTGTAQDAIITIDAAARIGTWNRAAERILGYTAQEAIGRQVHDFLAPPRFQDKAGQGMRHFATTGAGEAIDKTTELAAVRKDRAEIIVELSLAGALVAGRWEAVGILRDITARKQAEALLQYTNILLTTQMEASPDGILVVDADRTITSFNRRFAQMWQIPLDVLQAGSDRIVLVHVTALTKEPAAFAARVAYLYDHPGIASEDDIATTDGRSIERHTVALTSPAGQDLGRVWFFRDITERRRAAALALRMARYDVLTGLANRAVFVDGLEQAIARAKRGEKSFAVIYLDLDHFKDINDTLGHPVGDLLLIGVSNLLRANTRGTDTVARFGGDEFAIVVADISDPADAALLADKLIKAFGVPFMVQGSEIHTGASIGIATYDENSPDAETLLSHADVALYRAKSEGRGGYRFFTNAMDLEVQLRVKLGVELRDAIEGNQLFLLYQPQIEVETGKITGMEALVRWRHPQRGVIGPDIFIPIAEQIGIIAKLGHWVLWEACRQAKAWLDAGIAPLRISVNVSALQFRTPMALEHDIAQTLASTGLPPWQLELELTETVLMDASREHSDVLQRLRETGVTIAIDDFGTGYSSLDYLRRFPSNHIKIAQTFVKNLETSGGDAAIVRATIALARELGIKVIAEGVETDEQAKLLRGWGCGEVQGYHFARPLAASEATAALRAGQVDHGDPAG